MMTESQISAHKLFPPQDVIWLNTSHQGIIPQTAADAALDALRLKTRIHGLNGLDIFEEVPNRLRRSLAGLIDGHEEAIGLTTGASDALHRISSGMNFQAGDEIILSRRDFPATTLSFLRLERRGIKFRWLPDRQEGVSVSELDKLTNSKTKAVAVTLLDSFSGDVCDIQAVGEFCRSKNIFLIVNASQAVGVIPVSVSKLPIDCLVSCGFKWLCGPYATGFFWIGDRLTRELQPTFNNWLLDLDVLDNPDTLSAEVEISARAFEMFNTANFMNFMPWTESIETLRQIGAETISRHSHSLIDHFLNNLDSDKFQVSGKKRPDGLWSPVQFFSHCNRGLNRQIYDGLQDNSCFLSYRDGWLRLSPHIYNTESEIDRLLEILDVTTESAHAS